MSNLSEDIRTLGTELGFSMIGFAKAEPLIQEGVQLQDWLVRKYNGTMNWLEKNEKERTNPFLIMPNAKSVIVCAINYHHPETSKCHTIGKISKYAWAEDYHTVIKGKLKELWNLIASRKPDANGFIEVDSGPVMEKAWAQRAGIGWQGKHSILLNQEYGSWFFLGIIITDIELQYNSPVENMCGTCMLCIDACPTNAIVAPYVLNASNCISYFTIEYRGEVDKEVSNKFDNWIFGCDICQNVCPWNQKKAKISNAPEFMPREYSNGVEFEKILSMNEAEFNLLFNNSSIKRRKLEGLQENVKNVYHKKYEKRNL
ncbi:MAG: tRNA epoxyqueuosine(34) reductase QueG [Chlorobiaceae bacterium]|nr:tRNA epoxyqueuosine(34) reductase QueG [Chlorobiaceae bacterium]